MNRLSARIRRRIPARVAPVLVLQLLVQLELVVDGVHPSGKLLVLPGIGSGDAVGPHGEERDGPWGGFSHRSGFGILHER